MSFELVGLGAANLMDKLRASFGDDAVEVKNVLVIADVAYERDGEFGNETHYWTNDKRGWVLEALVGELLERISARREEIEAGDDD